MREGRQDETAGLRPHGDGRARLTRGWRSRAFRAEAAGGASDWGGSFHEIDRIAVRRRDHGHRRCHRGKPRRWHSPPRPPPTSAAPGPRRSTARWERRLIPIPSRSQAGRLPGTASRTSASSISLGTVDGDKVTFVENLDYQGTALAITYTGQIEKARRGRPGRRGIHCRAAEIASPRRGKGSDQAGPSLWSRADYAAAMTGRLFLALSTLRAARGLRRRRGGARAGRDPGDRFGGGACGRVPRGRNQRLRHRPAARDHRFD